MPCWGQMTYEITTVHEHGYVHLVYTGDVDIEQRKQARSEVFAIRKQHQLSRCLVETQESNMHLSTKDIIDFANSFPKDLPPGYHVSVVVGTDADVDTLIENLASSVGLRIRAFKDREAAIKWLLAF